MLDILNLPKPQNGYIDYFSGDVPVGITTTWRTWEKPRGISMIHITCFGAGGGGGGGSSVNQLGGGGGGSGGQTILLIPAHVLPDILYVSPGRGGVGANTFAGGGGDGSASYVSIAPSTDTIYLACYANAGGGGSSSGGFGANVAEQANALMSFQGFFFALAGQSGQNGSGVRNITYPATGLLVSGGAGGGSGGSFTSSGFGGSITAPTQSSLSFFSTRSGGTDGTSNRGPDGISLFQPLLSTGGAGGGGQGATGIALNGSGGNGGFGSGGGGVGNAGGSINAGTSSGKGGDGLVIIQCF